MKKRASLFLAIVLGWTLSFAPAWAAGAPKAPPGGAPVGPPADSPPSPGLAERPYIVTIHGTIDAGLLHSMKRRCEEALAAGADLIVFDVDTYGGLLNEGLEMADYVAGLQDVATVAYVRRKAISAGALFSVACDHIVMRRATTIGDCTPIIPSSEGGYQIVGEKTQSMLREVFRAYAEQNNIPVVLAQAMVTMEWEVLRISSIEDPDDWSDLQFIRRADFEELPKARSREIEKHETVCREGELLTMNDTRAVAYGFARARVDAMPGVLARYATAEGAGRAVRLEPSWTEEFLRWLNSPAISGLLMLAGLMALYMALKTPGAGVPEIIAVSCFAVLFGSKYAVGIAGYVDIVLVVVGVALLAVEVFIIPGFGFAGVAGVVTLFTGLVLMSQSFVLPSAPVEMEVFVHNVLYVLLALLLP